MHNNQNKYTMGGVALTIIAVDSVNKVCSNSKHFVFFVIVHTHTIMIE